MPHWPLSKPAGDATQKKRAAKLSERSNQKPSQWGLAAVFGTVVLLGLGKVFKHFRSRADQTDDLDAKMLPTHVLINDKGVEVHISPVGCAVERLMMPDRIGKLVDVVLGFDAKDSYLDPDTNHYFGIVVGRVANRIANASFAIDGKQHHVVANDGQHSLHGGQRGWGQQIWRAQKTTDDAGHPAVRLTYTSNSGDQGYPGKVQATVTYVLTEGKSKAESGHLRCIMEAKTDAPTPISLAQHTYWNLAGHNAGDILGHRLTINADYYTSVDDQSIPTGELDPVKGTPFDFNKSWKIGARINELPGGYDHNFVIKSVKSKTDDSLKVAAVLSDPVSLRTVEVATSAPGLQFYSGNFLDGTVLGKEGAAYPKHGGVALESQAFPNAVNQPQFPPVILRPGETYRHEVLFSLRTK